MNSVAVVGAGAWGTALAIQALRAGRQVTLWARDPARAASIAATRQNLRLPGHALPTAIVVTADMPTADLVLLAAPLQHLREVASHLPPGGPVVICAKGVETSTLRLPLEILAEALPRRAAAVLTGPNFAREIAAGLPAAAVVAAHDAEVRAAVVAALAPPQFRLYGNDDPIGAQVGGAAKNVIAIAAGAVAGAGLGENARAALVTRGLAELARLAVALGGRADTVAGLSGLGDVLLSCTSPTSRNYTLGVQLGAGRPLAESLESRTGVTEGVATAPALVTRAARAGASVPICEVVAAVLSSQMTLRQAIEALRSRPLRDE